jgi:tripartite-type tricarboxylate transporter receptor subunit TctC
MRHMMGEILRQATGATLTHAPYQGEVLALTAASGGHLPMVLVNASAIAPFAKNGRVRALVVTSRERLDLMPDVPTAREAGVPEFESANWSGFVVPAGTPAAAVARLNAEMVKAIGLPEVKEKFQSLSFVPSPSTPEQFGEFLKTESARFAKAAKAANLKLE